MFLDMNDVSDYFIRAEHLCISFKNGLYIEIPPNHYQYNFFIDFFDNIKNKE